MSPKVLLVVHQDTSDSGRIGRQLADRGFRLDIRCPLKGDNLPRTMAEHRGAVIFGGPQSANDDHKLAGLKKELTWIERTIEARVPLLGICLGAQLVARALGAKIDFHPEGLHEIGYHPITPLGDWPHGFERTMHFYQWHKETFEVPVGAVRTAAGEMYPNQGFRYGRCCHAIQFHPEVTREIVHRWTRKPGGGLLRPEAQSPECQIAAEARHAPAVEAWTARFLDHWIGRPESPARAAAEPMAAAAPPPGE